VNVARRAAIWAVATFIVGDARLSAQHHDTTAKVVGTGPGNPRLTYVFGAEATTAVTRVSATPYTTGSLTEANLTRPIVTAHLGMRGVAALNAELNLEGVTMRRGELNPGIYGEGYYDRRHPHTLFHDVVLTLDGPGKADAGLRTSLSAGRGFAPFGTDDPMSRPFLKFPANHHLAQLLERLVVVGAASVSAVSSVVLSLEGALLNGDDPVGPFSAPQWNRFGDSWSGRVTAVVRRSAGSAEIQASYAKIRSPDIAVGGGLDQKKRSASARFTNSRGGWNPYGLIEWASTDALDRTVRAYRLETILGEVAVRPGRFEAALRSEIADRPEEERGLDPFRSPRPPHDLLNLGITRWRTLSGRFGARFGRGASVLPFVEASYAVPRARIAGAVFEPERVYAARRIITLSVGTRFGVGGPHGRMGRYGVAAPELGIGAHR
jgi:hypothetical protein